MNKKDKLTHSGIAGPENTVGGIIVDVDQNFSAGGYSYQVGSQQMNGKEALAYSIHLLMEIIKYQQDVLMAMFNHFYVFLFYYCTSII